MVVLRKLDCAISFNYPDVLIWLKLADALLEAE